MPKATASPATTGSIKTAAAAGIGTSSSSRACDQCNYRRIKCDRALPCDRCELSKLGCTYDKAPKLRGGKRIKELQDLNKDSRNAPTRSEQQEIPADNHTLHNSTASTSYNTDNTTNNTSSSDLELARNARPHSFSPSTLSHHQFSPLDNIDSDGIASINGGNHTAPAINRGDAVGIANSKPSSSHFPSISSFSESPAATSAISSGNQPFMDAGDSSFLARGEASTSQYSSNNNSNNLYSPATFSNPSSNQAQHSTLAENILPGVFHPDNFLDSLYENVQPPSQEFVDFSFLQSWPYWLTGTAANSPESINPQGMNERRESNLQSESELQTAGYTQPQGYSSNTEIDWLSDSHLIPAIATFFERLHPIMPIFTRSWILDRIDKDEHRSHPSFAAMLLALSSLVKIQPVKAVDRTTRSQRNEQARRLLEQSVRIRANVLLGQEQSLDEVLASFYSFATLFGMQEHNAATFRLRESVTLAQLMKLNLHESYMFLDPKEQERRLRTYWLLCITERAYALQRGDSVTLRGRPVADMAFVVSGLPANNFNDFPQRQLGLFENVDEAFVDCWHGRCARANCTTFTRDRARLLHASFGAIYPEQVDASTSTRKISHLQKEMIQNIDTVVTSHWLQSRLWQICLSHGLLSSTSPEILFRPAFVLQCAYQAHQFHVSADASSREAHGVGLVEKLFDIGTALLQARVLSTIDDLLKNNIDQLLSIYVADLDNSSEEGKAFAERLNRDWGAVSND